MIAGLEEISEGELYIGDRLVNDVAPKDRDIAMVFQNYALYPHMTVFENMAFGLKLRKVPKDEISRKVEEAARILDITHLLDRKPKALSGGQRQRVALGRAIVREPQVFLLDEPLSNLDAKLRAQMRTEISKLHQKLGTTFVYVTHDQTEAMTMGDRIVVMKDGFVQQVDSPQNLYESPVNQFVAGFMGSPQMNFIDGIRRSIDGKYAVEFGSEDSKTTRGKKYYIEIPESKSDEPELAELIDQEIIMGIRPEDIHDEEIFISNARTGIIDADVEITEMMGAETYLYLLCEGIPLTARVDPRSTARPQDTIKVALDPNKMHIFNKETEKTVVN
jgi:multiple sugar transport system ATP-binding protein